MAHEVIDTVPGSTSPLSTPPPAGGGLESGEVEPSMRRSPAVKGIGFGSGSVVTGLV